MLFSVSTPIYYVQPLNEIDIRWYLEQRFKSEVTSIYSIAYLSACLKSLKKKINDGVVAVTTICLTPHEEFTGGWEGSDILEGLEYCHTLVLTFIYLRIPA
jgi:hypothetical protein